MVQNKLHWDANDAVTGSCKGPIINSLHYTLTRCLELYLNQRLEDEPCMVILVPKYLNMIVVGYILTVMGCSMSSNWTSVWNGCVLQVYQSFLSQQINAGSKSTSISNKVIPIKCFFSHRPTDPFFFGNVKKKKHQNHLWRSMYFSLQAHDIVLFTSTVLNYHRYFVFVAFLDIW